MSMFEAAMKNEILENISDEEMSKELDRQARCRQEGNCSYCNQPLHPPAGIRTCTCKKRQYEIEQIIKSRGSDARTTKD